MFLPLTRLHCISVAVHISEFAVKGQQTAPVNVTTVTECTDENIFKCVGAFLQLGTDPTDVILNNSRALEFCA